MVVTVAQVQHQVHTIMAGVTNTIRERNQAESQEDKKDTKGVL